MNSTNSEKARKIITENIYCTLATATNDGKPWVSPLYFNYDSSFNIYWVSAKDSLHSQLIKKNNRVAIVIFDSSAAEGTGDGVYIEARAREITENELPSAIGVFFSGRHLKVSKSNVKKPTDYSGDSPVRMYKAIPDKVYTLTEGKRIKGYYVDERVEVKL